MLDGSGWFAVRSEGVLRALALLQTVSSCLVAAAVRNRAGRKQLLVGNSWQHN